MKKILFLSILSVISSTLIAQSFPGYRSGNYTGVNGVFFNPASIADSRYRWDVNLFALNGTVGNSNATYSLKDLASTFDSDVDSFFFGNSNKSSSGIVNVEILGPSFMFNIGAKNSFALSTRTRIFGNAHDIDGNIIKSINSDNDDLPFTLSSSNNQKIILNAWTEIGASYGRVLYNKGKHFLKGGITAKYLTGSANSFANIDNLKGTLDEDLGGEVYLTNASGRIALGVSGVDLDNFEASNAFSSNGTGLGFDLGFIYEYRPAGDGSNKYKFKAGLALLDMGSIKYEPRTNEFGDYTINIPSTSQWYPSDLEDKSIAEIKDYLDASPFFTNNAANVGSYKSKLPTTIQANIDYNIHKGFYAELSGQLSLAGKDNDYSAFQYNSITLVPRFEAGAIGVSLPINYNELTNFNMGVSLRMGPVFIGSGSVLTALLDKSKQADVFFGLHIGGLKKNKKKKSKD